MEHEAAAVDAGQLKKEMVFEEFLKRGTSILTSMIYTINAIHLWPPFDHRTLTILLNKTQYKFVFL